jgi:hypothetical protein
MPNAARHTISATPMPIPVEVPVPSLPPLLLLSFVEPAGLRAVTDPLGRRSASSVADDGSMVFDTLSCPATDGTDCAEPDAVVGTGVKLGLPGLLVPAGGDGGAGAGAGTVG